MTSPVVTALDVVSDAFPADVVLREETDGLAAHWVRETDAGIVVVSVTSSHTSTTGFTVVAEVPLPMATAALAAVVPAGIAVDSRKPAVPGLATLLYVCPGLRIAPGPGRETLHGYGFERDGLTVTAHALDPDGDELAFSATIRTPATVRRMLAVLR